MVGAPTLLWRQGNGKVSEVLASSVLTGRMTSYVLVLAASTASRETGKGKVSGSEVLWRRTDW